MNFRDIFGVSFSAVAVSAAQDLFEITGPSNGMVVLLALNLYQTTDLGDAQEEVLRVTLLRYSTGGSGGSTPTARNLNPNGGTFGGTAEANNTARGGTPVVVRELGWNIRIPLDRVLAPQEWLWVAPSGIIAVGLEAAPTDAVTASGSIIIGVL